MTDDRVPVNVLYSVICPKCGGRTLWHKQQAKTRQCCGATVAPAVQSPQPQQIPNRLKTEGVQIKEGRFSEAELETPEADGKLGVAKLVNGLVSENPASIAFNFQKIK